MQLQIEKVINRSVPDVFDAVKAGRIFMNCGADSSASEFDFRVGGKYRLEFKNIGKFNAGEFIEIVPNKKIVFSWHQNFSSGGPADTRVTIELFAEGAGTRLFLKHEGFTDQEVCDGHKQGWTAGIDDLTLEIERGRLRMVRTYPVSVHELYEYCKSPTGLFGAMGDLSRGEIAVKVGGQYRVPTKNGQVRGEFLELEPDKKVSFSWLESCGQPMANSRVTLNFSAREKGAAVELIHEGLPTTEDQMKHRVGWESLTREMANRLGRIPWP